MPIQGRFVEEGRESGWTRESEFICLESCLERFGRACYSSSAGHNGMTCGGIFLELVHFCHSYQ